MGAWTGVEKGLSALGGTFDDMSVRDRQERMDARQAKIDALHEPVLLAQGAEATEKVRTMGRLRDYDVARAQNEADMSTATVPDVAVLPNPDFQPATPEGLKSSVDYFGERNETVPAAPAQGLPMMTQSTTRNMTDTEKYQKRVDLMLKHGVLDDVTKLGALVDISNKVREADNPLMAWAKKVFEVRDQFGPEMAKTIGAKIAPSYKVTPEQVAGFDFMASGEIYKIVNGVPIIVDRKGGVHVVKPNTDDKAHNTIDDSSPDGTMTRKLQYNPASRRYDIPATGWSKIPKTVVGAGTTALSINGLSVEEQEALSRAIDNGLDPYKINSRTAKIYAQQEIRVPNRRWNELGATAAFERNVGVMNTKALLNSIEPLLGKLEEAGAILGNSNIPAYNRAVNYLKEQTGSADIVGFNNLRDDTIAELERGLLNTGVLSDSKYLRALKNVNSAQSLPQLKAATANMRIVIRARLEALAKGPGAKTTASTGGKLPSGLPPNTVDNRDGTFTLPNGKVVRPKK